MLKAYDIMLQALINVKKNVECYYILSSGHETVLIYLFVVLRHFQHSTGHIRTGSFVARGNQYIQLVKVLYCKLPTICKQLPTFLHKAWGLKLRPQSVFPLHHCGLCETAKYTYKYFKYLRMGHVRIC